MNFFLRQVGQRYPGFDSRLDFMIFMHHRPHPVGQVAHLLDDGGRFDPVRLVVCHLNLAAAVGLADRALHRGGHGVGIQNHLALDMPGRPPDVLDQGLLRPQETFLVRIEDRHQRDFRQVDTLAQQVDADDDIINAQAQVSQDFDTLNCFDLRMQIMGADTHLDQVLRQVFGHALGQRGDQRALAVAHPDRDLLQQVFDLAFHRANFNFRVKNARRPDNLLHHRFADAIFVGAGRGGGIDRLPHALLKLLELERTVVKRARQPEAVIHQGHFAGTVTVVHTANLRDRHVALVDHQQIILREVIHQRKWRAAGWALVQVARVILDAAGKANFADHLDIIIDALLQTLGFQQFALRFQESKLLIQFLFNVRDRLPQLRFIGDIFAGRVDDQRGMIGEDFPRQRVKLDNALDFIAEKRHPVRRFCIGGHNLQRIAAHPERTASQVHVIAAVLDRHKLPQDRIPPDFIAHLHFDHRLGPRRRVADTINAGYRRHDNHIAAVIKRGRCRQAQALDVLVDLGLLLDVEIMFGHIGFWLIVIVIADEVFNGVAWEQFLKLRKKLCRQGFVVRHHQRRFLHLLDHLRNRESLAGAGGAQQGLIVQPFLKAFDQFFDSSGLITGRLKLGDDLEWGHCISLSERQFGRGV